MTISVVAINTLGLVLQIFISKSYDATSHFETTCDDVLSLFERITGQPFDTSNIKHTDMEAASE